MAAGSTAELAARSAAKASRPPTPARRAAATAIKMRKRTTFEPPMDRTEPCMAIPPSLKRTRVEIFHVAPRVPADAAARKLCPDPDPPRRTGRGGRSGTEDSDRVSCYAPPPLQSRVNALA